VRWRPPALESGFPIFEQEGEFWMLRLALRSARLMPFIVIVGLASVAEGTTIEPMTLDEMAQRADFILIGRAVGSRADWSADHTRLYTYVTFEVERFLKGGAGEREVTIRLVGGEVAGIRVMVPGTPQFAQGEEVLLFCVGKRARVPTLLGLSLGKFTMRRDENGERVLKRDISGLVLANYRTDSREPGSPPSVYRLAEVEARIEAALAR
jgi:hypothetical protein